METAALVISLLFMVLAIAIIVGISRWVFRINDIIGRMDKVIELLERQIRLRE
jgi:uncharacterized protein YoxC